MEYILGLLSGVVFFAVMGAFLFIGYKMGQKKHTAQPVDEEEQRKMQQFDKYFKDIFSYDVDKALQRKKVTDE
ncbi:hypothetical protein [Cytobacillus oceanisediminis]|uniref:hypothetical protein n=1 Tax=Cytobacillus oceanisediminis TaxID=665099 RepID=UPI003735D341